MLRVPRSVILLTLFGATAACARSARVSSAARPDTAAVIFTNQSQHQADVYAIPQSGARVRIGTVQSGRTDTLTVSGTALPLAGTVTIVADLLASSTSPRTGPVALLPGERISVTLPATMSTLSVLPAPR